MKRLMLGALAALCAMLALPAFASAEPVHVSPTADFSVHGGPGNLTRAAGGNTTGTTTTGTGSFENTTTGTVQLTFHHVTADPGGFTCTSTGQPAGTVQTTKLQFHLVTLQNANPGILITPNATIGADGKPIPGTTHFATLHCGIFVGTIVVKGDGILGTITAPECGKSSNTATLSFKSSSPGVQEHLKDITGNEYDLESSLSGGAFSTSAMDAHATITFNGGATPTLVCT